MSQLMLLWASILLFILAELRSCSPLHANKTNNVNCSRCTAKKLAALIFLANGKATITEYDEC